MKTGDYIKRFKYGLYVARITGRTMDASYLAFRQWGGSSGIGSGHWHRKITFAEYLVLGTYYAVMKKINLFELINKKTWIYLNNTGE